MVEHSIYKNQNNSICLLFFRENFSHSTSGPQWELSNKWIKLPSWPQVLPDTSYFSQTQASRQTVRFLDCCHWHYKYIRSVYNMRGYWLFYLKSRSYSRWESVSSQEFLLFAFNHSFSVFVGSDLSSSFCNSTFSICSVTI